MQNFGQSFPKDCVLYPAPALIVLLKYSPNSTILVPKIQNFPASEGRHTPLETPERASAQLALTPNPIDPEGMGDISPPIFDKEGMAM